MVVYFAGGPPRQTLAQGQSNPHGPQPLKVSPRAARIARTATRRAIRQTPSTGTIYSRILTKSRRGVGARAPYSGNTRVTCPIFRPGRAAVLP